MSFLFKCCKQDPSKQQQYQIQTREGNHFKTQYVGNVKDIKDWEHAGRVLRIKRSQYDDLIKKYNANNKWTDPTFPPGPKSLGVINNVPTDCQWKRISELLQNPQLFEGRIQPQDVIQGSLGDCYFLSAVSALAQSEGRIAKVFGNQQFNPAGIYKATLRIDGIIQQILIDDFIPVNKANKPLFCQPRKNQFWVLLLEKAWAKSHGSYANINSGTPSEVFKAVTYAPSQLHPIKKDPESRGKLWEDIYKSCLKDNPICCGTLNDPQVNWNEIGLTPAHAYTLIDAAQLVDEQGTVHRVLKIRNPWGFNEWKGSASENDHSFWSRIANSQLKQRFIGQTPFGNDGVFFMRFEDFCLYFNEVHFCHLVENAMYQVQPVLSEQGSIYTFNVRQQDDYIIELHQNGIRGQGDIKLKQGLNRSTLLLAKGNNYEFMDGSLKYQQEDNSLRTHLTPGQYYVYTKFDKTLNRNLMPENMSVSCYSSHFVDITPADKKDHPDFFKKVFLSYARNNRRKEFQNGLMWISWKLLFEKGGFAFLAFGVDPKANKKFRVTINEADFTNLGYELESPHKGKGAQAIEVLPGHEEIVIARVRNAPLQPMKFPPPMDIQIDAV